MEKLNRREFLRLSGLVGAGLIPNTLFPKIVFGNTPKITLEDYKVLPKEEKWLVASKLLHKKLTLEGKFATPKTITYLFDNLSDGNYSAHNQELSSEEINNLIQKYAELFKDSVINEKFLFSQMAVESKMISNSVSEVDAGGLEQILPITWSDHNNSSNFYENVFIPKENIYTATKFLNWLEIKCGNEEKGHPDWKYLRTSDKQAIILAAYHCGLSRLKSLDWHIISTPPKTRNYVWNIMKDLIKV
jgi:hypothetical protein